MEDAVGATRFTRVTIPTSQEAQTRCVDLSTQGLRTWGGNVAFDRHRVKLLLFVIERRHVGDGVENPVTGTLDFHHLFFGADQSDTPPADIDALLGRLEYRAAQYFEDWRSAKPESEGLAQDRSTFADLLSVGGTGFALPGYVIAAERGWLTRAEAAQRVVAALRVLDRPDAFGPGPVGRIGTHGFFYHFLGVDGRRKLNFDFPATPNDESLNTVEVSTIDTSLLVIGALVAQSYFDSLAEPIEAEIRQRVQAIYDRVDWPFMFEAASQQLYLGWKPNEVRDAEPAFEIPDAEGGGKYSGVPDNPATLDYYTDEALIALLLGINSRTHPLPANAWQTLIAVPDAGGLIRTWPGSLFTYQFLHAFVDTRTLSRCEPVNWYANSALAIRRTIAYVESNPRGYATYGANAWGLSAAEGPYDGYHAYAAPSAAVANPPDEDGTVTYYGMVSSLTFGTDLRQRAIAAINAGWARGHWHSRFGLPDAFNDEVAQATLDPAAKDAALRKNGPWVQRALFAIDQGPMLLHLENARSGLIWQLTARNPNLAGTLRRLCTASYLPLILANGGTTTATATPRPTPTITGTAAWTNTPRPTPTRTPTSSATTSSTVAASVTPSPFATATMTRTPTATATWTPTHTPTASPTPSKTPSPTSTCTATNTPTPTQTITPPVQIVLEAEYGTGNGTVMPRSNASEEQTRWLHVGESFTLTMALPNSAAYSLTVRYSNDSYEAPLEVVVVSLDGQPISQFTAADSGDGGHGWNNFYWSPPIGDAPVQFAPESHILTLFVASGDYYGVEIDCIRLQRDP